MEQEKPRKVCGSKLRKKPGKFCQKTPLKGKRRCAIHGGKSLAGFNSPSFKHGRYSSILPTDLRKRYEASKRDPELLTHEPEIRLLDVHLHALVNDVVNARPKDNSAELRVLWTEMEKAQSAGDMPLMKAKLDEVGRIIMEENHEKQNWEEVREVLELRRKVLESETKRIKETSHSMGAEQLLAIIEYIVDVLRESVIKYADRIVSQQILTKVTADLRGLVSKPSNPSPRTTRLIN